MHGGRTRKMSDYGLQLREKQRVKRTYGLLERQFKNYFEKATKLEGVTGENFLRMLETRMDSVIYSMGMASSRNQARQWIRQGKFALNGKEVNIPSITLKEGDEINVIATNISAEVPKDHKVPEWISYNAKTLKGKVIRLPIRKDIDEGIQERLIIEFYSR